MKKKLIYILIGLLIIIGGYFAMGEYQKQQLIKEAYKKAEVFLQDNYEGIHDISLSKDNIFFDPLGGVSIGGHVNEDSALYFNIRFDLPNKKVGKVTSIVNPKNFPSEKEECKDNFCQ